MAANDASTNPAEETEQQITFNVKSSSAENKYVITVAASSTVGELKQKLSTAEYANLPPERQRLIYSGRVLKDPDTIASCKIKDGNTVHMVQAAASNQRQNPASQGTTATPAAANVPTNIAAGTGAGNPLAQLTGARYAGFHGLPGADSFGADGGMGAPPNPDQMLRMLDDPNFAQQMNEAMNNPAVIDMLRNNPMIRNNPMARAAIENPELRRMMMDPNMLRMQMQMQRAMGGNEQGGAAFPMPGATDTTPGADMEGTTGTNNTTTGSNAAANPFAALFPGAGTTAGAANNTTAANPGANPFAGLFGAPQGGDSNPIAQMTQQMMQNPEAMRQMMQMMGGGGGFGGMGGAAESGFNPWAALGNPEPAGPPDTRPPEERYESQLRQLNDMGFFDFDQNVGALRRSGGSVQGAIEYLLSQP